MRRRTVIDLAAQIDELHQFSPRLVRALILRAKRRAGKPFFARACSRPWPAERAKAKAPCGPLDRQVARSDVCGFEAEALPFRRVNDASLDHDVQLIGDRLGKL